MHRPPLRIALRFIPCDTTCPRNLQCNTQHGLETKYFEGKNTNFLLESDEQWFSRLFHTQPRNETLGEQRIRISLCVESYKQWLGKRLAGEPRLRHITSTSAGTCVGSSWRRHTHHLMAHLCRPLLLSAIWFLVSFLDFDTSWIFSTARRYPMSIHALQLRLLSPLS